MLSNEIRESILTYYSSTLTFLFFSLSLIIPNGLFWGPVFLFLAGIPYVLLPSSYRFLTRKDIFLIGTFLLFSGIWIGNSLLHSAPLRNFDNPVRFITAIIALFFLLRHPPKENFIWAGICMGAIATGIWAIWEKSYLGSVRVSGHTNAIQYGNLSILLGILCVVGMGWAVQKEKRKGLWIIILTIGFLLGITASALSGSRGGWIGLVFIFIYILSHFKGIVSKKGMSALIIIFPLFLLAAYLIPQTGVQKRLHEISTDLHKYNEGYTYSSIGTRLELWQGGVEIIKEKPLWGWGDAGYESRLQELIDSGRIKPHLLSHPHNEFLYISSHYGLIGGCALLLLYLMPIVLFYRSERHLISKLQIPLAISGPVIAISYIDFGLSQAFFAHTNGVMFYAFSIVILYSAISTSNRKHLTPRSDHT